MAPTPKKTSSRKAVSTILHTKREHSPRDADISTRLGALTERLADAAAGLDPPAAPVVLLPPQTIEQVQERAKELGKKLTLTDDDKDFAKARAEATMEECWREGGYIDLRDRLKESASTLAGYQFECCMRAESVKDGTTVLQTAARLAYASGLFKALEHEAQVAERKERIARAKRNKETDTDITSFVAVDELLGDYWKTSKSGMLRSLAAGLLPSNFKNGTSFVSASKVKKSKGADTSTTGKSTGSKVESRAQDMSEAVTAYAEARGIGDATKAALAALIDAVKRTDVDADVEVAVILTECVQALSKFASGTYVQPERTAETPAVATA